MENTKSILSSDDLNHRYQAILSANLSLDLTRGKPSLEQLSLSEKLLQLPGAIYQDESGQDCRNYGGIDGLPEMKKLFSEILAVQPENIIVGGSSSLTMMYEYLSRAVLFGAADSVAPWSECKDRKFICPVPGYDRHFGITEHLGFTLVSVNMLSDGPDMDQVEEMVAMDETIKGIWCVPKYSNPTGACYSDEVVIRLASMDTAAKDFKIIWDNAYAEHHLSDHPPELSNIYDACYVAGNLDRVIEFASTSKMTFPGAGVAAMAASERNLEDTRQHIAVQSIGPDKLNQLRHLQLFPDMVALRRHMKKHMAIVKPRFDIVHEVLELELRKYDVAQWTKPDGGYFISLDMINGSAKTVIELAAKAGVALTKAGAPFPYGEDPNDQNIRIAPTFASVEDVRAATEVLCVCILLSSLNS